MTVAFQSDVRMRDICGNMSDDIKKVGVIKKEIINILKLDISPGTPIYIGKTNIEHIKSRHPAEFDLYFSRMEEILDNPDYVGKNEKNDSIDYVKIYRLGSEYLQVSVRVASSGSCFVRTMFLLMTYKAERYIEQGTLIKIS